MTATLAALPDMADAPISPAPVASEHAQMWALVQRAQAGDAEAFGQIWAQYADQVFRFIYFRCGNRDTAHDLSSEVWLRALKRIGSFTYEGRDVGAWLITISRNLLVDFYKCGPGKREVSTADVFGSIDNPDGDRWTQPERVAEHTDLRDALRDALAELNPWQRRCIELRFLEGKSVAETAEAMGTNDGVVKTLQYRATRALARNESLWGLR